MAKQLDTVWSQFLRSMNMMVVGNHSMKKDAVQFEPNGGSFAKNTQPDAHSTANPWGKEGEKGTTGLS